LLPTTDKPVRQLPPDDWEHSELYRNVRHAITALPVHFRTETFIAGINATDLQTLNSALGATIEEQAVATLNSMRVVWDPDGKYVLYNFVRQAQAFPDVLLRNTSDGSIILGVEMKGWYLLSKESEPSFRFQVTAAVCAPQDLIVIVPWVLTHVVSGSPMLFEPFVESARHAADCRTYYWQHGESRRQGSDPTIKFSTFTTPYPKKSDKIVDVPAKDAGNFGRLARTRLLDEHIAAMKSLLLCGIRIEYWLKFFSTFQSGHAETDIRKAIDRLITNIEKGRITGEAAIIEQLEELQQKLL
jgi:hypothetical protein